MGEIITRIDLDLAYCAEKVLNLDILLMHATSRLSDCEALYMENKSISSDVVEKAFEFDALSGILDCEIQELDTEAQEIEEKLRHAEESLRHSQEQVTEIRMQTQKFDGALALGRKEIWNEDDWQMQTVEQQRHILRMLEKSLARELDLERELSDARNNSGVQIKLHLVEKEEPMQAIRVELVEAGDASEMKMGFLSRESLPKIRALGVNLDGSVPWENEARSAQNDSKLKSPGELTEEVYAGADSGSLMLKENAKSKGSDLRLQLAMVSMEEAEDQQDIQHLERAETVDLMGILEETCSMDPTGAESEEARWYLEEKASDAQMERKTLIFAARCDMKKLIKDLKSRVHEAEVRAADAELRCSLLIESNSDLSEELGFLKRKVETMEGSLHKAVFETNTAYAKNAATETGVFTCLKKRSVECIPIQRTGKNRSPSDLFIFILESLEFMSFLWLSLGGNLG
ncbi:unnamed protein product [Spirodela intermedia]|uniref:WIT1/2 N-terminal helical bundle domain-containing protein n=1 Tax=Spirodela intermedia TaxID=51605 RepID=A0A7I8ITZ6_SPIIN|nr:unnamed protein product [Spirodela intermedia]CAA6661504.1 unnamed protein product [Spirodela intermedia]